jgi:hypothetical protein
MAFPRERTRVFTRRGGTCGRFTWWPDYGSGVEVNSGLAFARDSVGWEDDYPLDFDRQEYSGGTMNQAFSGYFSSWFNNWVPEILRAGFNLSHLHTSSDSDVDPYYATKAVARSNPSKPFVDLPVELLQLHELADLIRPGRRPNAVAPAQQLGSQYLMTSFGVMPVADAMARLYHAHSVIDRRIQVIERLRAKGYRKTMDMDVSTAQSTEYWYIDTAHSTAGGNFNISTVAGVRAHVRWGLYPGAFAGHETPNQMRAAVRQAAEESLLGSTIDLSTVWQITPFTWLIDWFLGVGDYLKSQRNTGLALLKEVVVMRHRKTVATYPGITYEPGGGAKTMHIDPIRMERESKSRRFSFPSPLTAHLPLLDSGSCATLASLAATR